MWPDGQEERGWRRIGAECHAAIAITHKLGIPALMLVQLAAIDGSSGKPQHEPPDDTEVDPV